MKFWTTLTLSFLAFSYCMADSQPPFQIGEQRQDENFRQIYFLFGNHAHTGTDGSVVLVASNPIIVADEDIFVVKGTTLNFKGAGVTATDGGNGVIVVTIPGGGSSSGNTTWYYVSQATAPLDFQNTYSLMNATGARIQVINTTSMTPINGIYIISRSSIGIEGDGTFTSTWTGRGGALFDGTTTYSLAVRGTGLTTINGDLTVSGNGPLGRLAVPNGTTIAPGLIWPSTLQGFYTTRINLDVAWFNVNTQSLRFVQSGGVNIGSNGGSGWGSASLFVSSQTTNRPMVIVASDTKKFQVDGSSTLVGNSLEVVMTTGSNVNLPFVSRYSMKVSSTPDFNQISVSSYGYLNAVSSMNIHVLSGCGASPTIYGGGNAFTITPGAGATGCTITFMPPFLKVPVPMINQATVSLTAALSRTITNEQLVISQIGIGTFDVHLIGGD